MAANNSRNGLRHWSGWDYLPGIAFTVIGVLAIMEAPLASIATGIYLGAMLCVAGVFGVAGGVAHLGKRGALLAALLGLLGIAVGGAVILNPVAGAISIVWLIGAWFLVGSILELAMAITAVVGRGWLVLVGLTNLVLGILVFSMHPASAFVFLGYLVGISLLARGLWSIVFVGKVHHLGDLLKQATA